MRSTIFCALFFFASVGQAQDIRAIDFRNRVWTDTSLGSVRTRHGSYSEPTDTPFRQWFMVYGVAFGDLDGDGGDEAVVATGCGGLGVEPVRDTRVFALRDGRLREVARLDESERNDGLVLSLRIERGVVIERRLANDLGATPARYSITHRRGLRDGRLVELTAATVACAPQHSNCARPTALPTSVYFGVGRTDVRRLLPIDANGHFPALDVLLDAGQSLQVDAWCTGTELAALQVAAPDATVVEYPREGTAVVGRAHPAGSYRVSVRARRPVGICYVSLVPQAVDRDELPQ